MFRKILSVGMVCLGFVGCSVSPLSPVQSVLEGKKQALVINDNQSLYSTIEYYNGYSDDKKFNMNYVGTTKYGQHNEFRANRGDTICFKVSIVNDDSLRLMGLYCYTVVDKDTVFFKIDKKLEQYNNITIYDIDYNFF